MNREQCQRSTGLHDFIAGLALLLSPEGVLTLEFPHLQRLIEGSQSFSGSYTIDLDMWFKMLTAGDLYFVPESLCTFRLAAASWSVEFVRDQAQQTKDLSSVVPNARNASMTDRTIYRPLVARRSSERAYSPPWSRHHGA